MNDYHWSFFVPGTPIAQPRARATVRGGHAKIYTPTKGIKAWKWLVQTAARQNWHGEPMSGPFGVDLCFVFPRPQEIVWKKKPMPGLWHMKKPDRDNLDKAILDSLTGIFWKDDCQVCCGSIRKTVAAGHEPEGVTISIRLLADYVT